MVACQFPAVRTMTKGLFGNLPHLQISVARTSKTIRQGDQHWQSESTLRITLSSCRKRCVTSVFWAPRPPLSFHWHDKALETKARVQLVCEFSPSSIATGSRPVKQPYDVSKLRHQQVFLYRFPLPSCLSSIYAWSLGPSFGMSTHPPAHSLSINPSIQWTAR